MQPVLMTPIKNQHIASVMKKIKHMITEIRNANVRKCKNFLVQHYIKLFLKKFFSYMYIKDVDYTLRILTFKEDGFSLKRDFSQIPQYKIYLMSME